MVFFRAGKSLAKRLMRLFPRHGDPSDLHLQEIFEHDVYRNAPASEQERIRRQSAQFTYEYERDAIGFFDHYFPEVPPAAFRGARMLDLGSFTGGRLVYWAERYGLAEGRGIDVDPVYAQAGNEFAALHGVPVRFEAGVGERLPYDDESFDFVASYDVFEHVQDLAQVMRETWRVLKPGGRLLTVFPPYYNPLEAHLRLATSLHGLHLLFPGRVLTAAYYEVLRDRGPDAAWYARSSAEPAEWERSPFLNGTTAAGFRRLIRSQPGWRLVRWRPNSLVSHGRRSRRGAFRALARVMSLPARVPLLEEVMLGRICCTLEKR